MVPRILLCMVLALVAATTIYWYLLAASVLKEVSPLQPGRYSSQEKTSVGDAR